MCGFGAFDIAEIAKDLFSCAEQSSSGCVERYSGRLIMLRDRARVLARSDQPDTKPG
jgi:hypothetical protein